MSSRVCGVSCSRSQESKVKALGAQVRQMADSLRAALGGPEPEGGKRPDRAARPLPPADLPRALAAYPALRFEHILLLRLGCIYLGLRGYLSDRIDMINGYRQALTTLSASLSEPGSEVVGREASG
jgi:hypothetical protein